MSEQQDNNYIDNIRLNPLQTPQIVQSKRALRRLARNEPLPGFHMDTEDGEADQTLEERIRDVMRSVNEKKKLH